MIMCFAKKMVVVFADVLLGVMQSGMTSELFYQSFTQP